MSQLKWDDDLKYSILQLKMNLNAKEFRLAGPAIGLPKKKLASEYKAPSNKNVKDISARKGFDIPKDVNFGHPSPRQAPPSQSRVVKAHVRKKSIFDFDLLIASTAAHVVDIFFVILTLVCVMIIAGLVMDPYGLTTNLETLKLWWPYRLITDLGLKYLLISIYAVFLTYWTVFKLFIGYTLGSFLVLGDYTDPNLFLEQ